MSEGGRKANGLNGGKWVHIIHKALVQTRVEYPRHEHAGAKTCTLLTGLCVRYRAWPFAPVIRKCLQGADPVAATSRRRSLAAMNP